MNWRPELFRTLLASTARDVGPDLSAYDTGTIAAHVDLLIRAGLACRSNNPDDLLGGVTRTGHRFLRSASNDVAWHQATAIAIETVEAAAGVLLIGTLAAQLGPEPSLNLDRV